MAKQGFLNVVYKNQWYDIGFEHNANLAIFSHDHSFWDPHEKEIRIVHYTMEKPWGCSPHYGIPCSWWDSSKGDEVSMNLIGRDDVRCGEHSAPTCSDCLQGHGSDWCNGDCVWFSEGGGVCHVRVVNCGGHSAPTCADCPEGYGEDYCHGNCVWSSRVCQSLFEHSSTAELVKIVKHDSMGGHLGNQIFEHAATLALAKDFGKQACVVLGNTDLIYSYFVGPFHRDCSHFDPSQSAGEDGYAIFRQFPKSDESIQIHGYFQSWKYSVKPEDSKEIKRVFTVEPKYLKRVEAILDKESSTIFVNVGIHICWFDKDYLNNPPKKFYPRAMDHFRRRHRQQKVRFYVASDDIGRTQRLGVFSEDSVFSLEQTSPILDLATLMSCDGKIISAVTFGWWAAWLGPHQRGEDVIYYNQVFNMSHQENIGQVHKEDFYPPGLIEISLEAV